MTRSTTAAPVAQWAPLFSHYSEDTGPIRPYPSIIEATRAGREVTDAQPGVQFELMQRTDGGEWRSVAGGLGIREVINLRWALS